MDITRRNAELTETRPTPHTRKRPFRSRWGLGIVAVLAMVGGLSGCGNAGSTPATVPATTTETPAQSRSAGNGATTAAVDFGITIDSTSQTTDDDGNAAIMVTFTFTNNSDSPTAFMDGAVPILVRAFQGNTELDSATINGDDTDAANSQKEIPAGSSVQIHWAYKLADKSDVKIEAVTSDSSGDDVILDSKTASVN